MDMKIIITETDETDKLLDEIEAYSFVEFTRDGDEVTVHLTKIHPHNVAHVFIELTKAFPNLELKH